MPVRVTATGRDWNWGQGQAPWQTGMSSSSVGCEVVRKESENRPDEPVEVANQTMVQKLGSDQSSREILFYC